MIPAIEVKDVSKRFRLAHDKKTSLKERVIKLGRSSYDEFYALRDIRLTVASGETVALLGHNGSGKSTLLKCIGGILQPTAGEIVTRGRMASLLELGAGFHPDLTGRENVYLNASILGLARRDIERRFDEIVAFAELEDFIDNQVKHYSSGMYVRLGFAVAVTVEPDVLLVDEVLAVGDESFQRKCMERVRKFQREGRTIVVVTHNADSVREYCNRAVVLDHGRMIADGKPDESIRLYREALAAQGRQVEIIDSEYEHRFHPTYRIKVTGVTVEERAVRRGDPLVVHVDYDAEDRIEDLVFAFHIRDPDGRVVYGTNTDVLGVNLDGIEGSGRVTFTIDRVPLLGGTYPFSIGVHNHDSSTVYDFSDAASFEVRNPDMTIGLVDLPVRVDVSRDQTVPPAQGAARARSTP